MHRFWLGWKHAWVAGVYGKGGGQYGRSRTVDLSEKKSLEGDSPLVLSF